MMWPPPKYVPISVSWSEQGKVLLLAFGPSITSSFILKSRTHPMTLSMGTLCPWGRTRRGSICTQANVGKYMTRLLIQTFVFLLIGSPPRYTGLRSSKDDPSLFGRSPSVTRTPSTSRWKVLFSTLNSTCTHRQPVNTRRPQPVKLNWRHQMTVTLWMLEGSGKWTQQIQQLCNHFHFKYWWLMIRYPVPVPVVALLLVLDDSVPPKWHPDLPIGQVHGEQRDDSCPRHVEDQPFGRLGLDVEGEVRPETTREPRVLMF